MPGLMESSRLVNQPNIPGWGEGVGGSPQGGKGTCQGLESQEFCY